MKRNTDFLFRSALAVPVVAWLARRTHRDTVNLFSTVKTTYTVEKIALL